MNELISTTYKPFWSDSSGGNGWDDGREVVVLHRPHSRLKEHLVSNSTEVKHRLKYLPKIFQNRMLGNDLQFSFKAAAAEGAIWDGTDLVLLSFWAVLEIF